jgi:gas vesicle protein
VIAVIGTLGGVIITAVAGLLTASLTDRNQRALAETQAQRE